MTSDTTTGTTTEHGKAHPVTVTVNRRPVPLADHHVTGLAIKQAAVEAGVIPDTGFQLSEERGHGELVHIADDTALTVHEGSAFLAVAPDDNS